MLDVYLAAVPHRVQEGPVVPEARVRQIAQTANPGVRAQRLAVWRLLEIALGASLGCAMEDAGLTLTERGAWTASCCHLSLSHCDGFVAVALSDAPVGVDVEDAGRGGFTEAVARRMLTPREWTACQALPAPERKKYLLWAWTRKESAFKRDGSAGFVPGGIDAYGENLWTREVPLGGRTAMLSAAFSRSEPVRLHPVEILYP